MRWSFMWNLTTIYSLDYFLPLDLAGAVLV